MPYPLLMSVACAALMAAAPLPAQAVPDAQFEPAFQVFMRASQGEESAIAQAVDSFAALLKAEPANPVLQAYSGAVTAMRAQTTMLPWRKMAYAEDGLAQLDKALALLGPAHRAGRRRRGILLHRAGQQTRERRAGQQHRECRRQPRRAAQP